MTTDDYSMEPCICGHMERRHLVVSGRCRVEGCACGEFLNRLYLAWHVKATEARYAADKEREQRMRARLDGAMIAALQAAIEAGGYDAKPADHACLNVTGSDRCKLCNRLMGEWIEDKVRNEAIHLTGMNTLRCTDCGAVWVQDATDSMQGTCRCGGPLIGA